MADMEDLDEPSMDEGSMEEGSMEEGSIDDGSMDDGGEATMSMTPVERIDLASGEVVTLEPGGLHLMLFDLVEPLEVGETFELTLRFQDAPDEIVEVEVRSI